MKYVHVLVDYDNVRAVAEKQPSDVVSNLSSLVPELAEALHRLIPASEEVWLRFYGGWTELSERASQQHGWILSELSRFRGRVGPLRVKIAMATELICRRDLTLVGTYRDKAQKMVDTMLSVDLLKLAEEHDFSLVVVSDDEDFVPGIIASSCIRLRNRPVYVLRRDRAVASAANDRLLAQCNVKVATF